jgi:hypothetical protein
MVTTSPPIRFSSELPPKRNSSNTRYAYSLNNPFYVAALKAQEHLKALREAKEANGTSKETEPSPGKDSFSSAKPAQEAKHAPESSAPETPQSNPAKRSWFFTKGASTPKKSDPKVELKLTAPDMTRPTPQGKQINDLWFQYNLLLARQQKKQNQRIPKKLNVALQKGQQRLSMLIPFWNESARLLQEDYKQHISLHKAIEADLIKNLRQTIKPLKTLNPSKKARAWKVIKRIGIGFLALGGSVNFLNNTEAGQSLKGWARDEGQTFYEHFPLFNTPTRQAPQANASGSGQHRAEPLFAEVRQWTEAHHVSYDMTRHLFKGDGPADDARRIKAILSKFSSYRTRDEVEDTNAIVKKLIKEYIKTHHPDKKSHLPLSQKERQKLSDDYRDNLEQLKERQEKLSQKRFFDFSDENPFDFFDDDPFGF